MKKIIFIIIVVLFISTSCVPELTAPHSNLRDPLYGGCELSELNEYYTASSGVEFQWGSPETSVLLLRSTSSIPDDAVENGTAYSAGDDAGNARVIYAGNGSGAVDESITAEGVYYYRLFFYEDNLVYIPDSEEASTSVFIDAVYVHWNGDDAGSGFSAAPLRSIQAGVDLAALIDGIDTVRVAGDDTETNTYTGAAGFPAIVMKNDVSIYGGYNPLDWTDDANLQTWPSIIEVEGPVAGEAVTVLAEDLTGYQELHSLRINGFTSADNVDSTALKINSSDLHIEKCEITGGSPGGTAVSTGISIAYSTAWIGNNYKISGGANGTSIGIYASGAITAPSSVTIAGNNTEDCITGGDAEKYAYGIMIGTYVTANILGNEIKGCTNPDTIAEESCGISINNKLEVLIEGNIIDGGQCGPDGISSRGISIYGSEEGVEIYNNAILTSGQKSPVCVQISHSDVYLRNNTIRCESPNTTRARDVLLYEIDSTDHVYIQNNILYNEDNGGGSVSYNICQESYDISNAGAYLVQNNNFTGDTDYYLEDDGDSVHNVYSDLTAMDANVSACSSNLDEALNVDDFIGMVWNENPHTMSFASGGIDGEAAGWGAYFYRDFEGTARTGDGSGTGWSMGAYEYDTP